MTHVGDDDCTYIDDGWRICDKCKDGFTWMDNEPYPVYDDILLCEVCRPEGVLTDYEKEDIARAAEKAEKEGKS